MHEQRSQDSEEQEDESKSSPAQRPLPSGEAASQRDQFGEHNDAETHPLPANGILCVDEFSTNKQGRDRQGETSKRDPDAGFRDAGSIVDHVGSPW